jgi:hypothetical protein
MAPLVNYHPRPLLNQEGRNNARLFPLLDKEDPLGPKGGRGWLRIFLVIQDGCSKTGHFEI